MTPTAPPEAAPAERRRAERRGWHPGERCAARDDRPSGARTASSPVERPRGSGSGTDAEGESLEARTAAPKSLPDHLQWQLNLTPMSARDRAIAEALIESLDEDGYLRDPLEAIRAALVPRSTPTRRDRGGAAPDAALRPARASPAATCANACCVQLRQLDPDTPQALALARELAESHLEAAGARPQQRLARSASA